MIVGYRRAVIRSKSDWKGYLISMKGKFLDKTYLIISGIAIFAGGVGLLFFLENVLFLSQGWVIFVLFSIGYVVIATKFSLPCLSRLKDKRRGIALLAGLQITFIAVMFLIFYSGLLRLPENGLLLCGVVITGLGTITVQLYADLLKKLSRKGYWQQL